MEKFKNKDFEKRRLYHPYYMERFISLKAAADLLALGVFPNAKEVTESFAAFHAAEKYFPYSRLDPNVNVVCVGDGTKPRTAAVFAFLTKWNCHSVDPTLQESLKYNAVERLEVYQYRIEDVQLVFQKPVLICLVHSHATVQACLEHIEAPERYVISIPCCVPQNLGRVPCISYADERIWSPKNEVKIWSRV